MEAETCSIETGLLRKHPCGHRAVTHCLNCEQPLCTEHAVPQLNEGGHRTGKSMCQECVKAAKASEKNQVHAAQLQKQRREQAAYKATLEAAKAPPAPVVKKPVAPAPAAAAPEAKPEEAAPLEFTPKDGKLEYSRKPDNKGSDYKE